MMPKIVLCLLLIALIGCGKTEYRQGQNLYVQHCANCHMENGKGLGRLIPPLANSDWLKNNQSQLSCAIKYGMEGEIVVNDTTYNQVMPGVADLSEFQIANIINYINHAWGNDYGTAVVADIRREITDCK